MHKFIFTLLSLLIASFVFAQDKKQQKTVKYDSIENLNEVIITASKLLGGKFEAKNRTGSAYYLSSKDIEKHNYFDITRVMAEYQASIFMKKMALD
ncbi:hypothetical protein [Flavobacterium sp. CS20]|uniref:hypothetical protein n=1 Tax=Flavobacterium sp. CS20 TaxID=2775246 RepID=UPI00352FFB78